MHSGKNDEYGFTLVEVLVVTVLIGILAGFVVYAINPIEILRQSRDAKRISDINALNKAASIYYSEAINAPRTLFMGTSSVVYVSIPDPSATSTVGDQCQGLGLPVLGPTLSYHCASNSTVYRIDGTGWVPINFSDYAGGNILSSLPVDPINTTSTNLYYTYTTDGVGGYKFSAFLESQKNAPLMASDGGGDSAAFEKGTNLALDEGRGLIAYWPFDEGASSTAYDESGNGYNQPLAGSQTNGSYFTTGKVGPYAAIFNGGTFTKTPLETNTAFSSANSPVTCAGWIEGLPSSTAQTAWGMGAGSDYCRIFFLGGNGTATFSASFKSASGAGSTISAASIPYTTSTWYFLVYTYDGASQKLYLNGTLQKTVATSLIPATSTQNYFFIGSAWGIAYQQFGGNLDDLRVYDRALSASEIQEMYLATK